MAPWSFIVMKISFIKSRFTLIAAFLLIGGLGGSSYFGYKLAHSQTIPAPKNSARVTPQNTIAAYSASQPTRLIIPKIGVNAPSINLQLKADGTLETPNSATDVGWYRNSPTPGEIGPSVIVGHVDYVQVGPAVFWNLNKLQAGDIFEVQRVDGSTMKFKVDSVKQFSQSNFPTNEVYGNINYAGIRLITCGGTFNSQTHHYSDNTVVFGSLVSQ
jgi:LPXTG-site transpeptidase (sortase) family protein